jgi:hypothetical protein
MSERGIRAYIPPGRARHGETSAAGHRRLEAKPLAMAMADKLRRAGHRTRYRLRKQTVEPVFGQMKQARGFRQFLLRGLDKVRGEWALLCTAHNLLKLANAQPERQQAQRVSPSRHSPPSPAPAGVTGTGSRPAAFPRAAR